MSLDVKELKHLSIDERNPGSVITRIDDKADTYTESFDSLRSKFEKLKVLSSADKEIVIALRQRVVSQQEQLSHRKNVFVRVQEQLESLAATSRIDKERIIQFSRSESLMKDENTKLREEKNTIVCLNEALRDQLIDKTSAFDAVVAAKEILNCIVEKNRLADMKAKHNAKQKDELSAETIAKIQTQLNKANRELQISNELVLNLNNQIQILSCEVEKQREESKKQPTTESLYSTLEEKIRHLRDTKRSMITKQTRIEELENEKKDFITKIEQSEISMNEATEKNTELKKLSSQLERDKKDLQSKIICEQNDKKLAEKIIGEIVAHNCIWQVDAMEKQKQNQSLFSRFDEERKVSESEVIVRRNEMQLLADENKLLYHRLSAMEKTTKNHIYDIHPEISAIKLTIQNQCSAHKAWIQQHEQWQQERSQLQNKLQHVNSENEKMKMDLSVALALEKKHCHAEVSNIEQIGSLKAIIAYTNERMSKTVESNELKLNTLKEKLKLMQEQLSMSENERREMAENIQQANTIEDEVQQALAKIINAQEAMEGSFTCTDCMGLLHDATLLVPCGHSFCKKCLDTSCQTCSECKQPVSTTVTNKLLDELGGKFTYTRQVLTKLRQEISSSPFICHSK